MLEKFEDVLYGPQGGLLSGLIHLFQDYLPVGSMIYSRGRGAHSPLTQIACPVLFEVCPLMVRVRTMLLVRKSRKLIAQYTSER